MIHQLCAGHSNYSIDATAAFAAMEAVLPNAVDRLRRGAVEDKVFVHLSIIHTTIRSANISVGTR